MTERETEHRGGMNAEEIAAFHRWKNEEAPRVMLRGITEMVLCEHWDIQYDKDGRHWVEFRRRRDAMNRLLEEQSDADDRKNALKKAVWEKIVTLIVGAGAALGISWVTKRTGITIPGASP